MLLVPRVRPRCQGSPSRRGVCWPGAGRLGRAAVSWCRASGARCGFLVPGIWGALWFPGAGRLGRCGFLRVRVPGLCVLVWVLSVSVSDSCLWVSAPLFLPLISCLGSQGLHFFLLPFLSFLPLDNMLNNSWPVPSRIPLKTREFSEQRSQIFCT